MNNKTSKQPTLTKVTKKSPEHTTKATKTATAKLPPLKATTKKAAKATTATPKNTPKTANSKTTKTITSQHPPKTSKETSQTTTPKKTTPPPTTKANTKSNAAKPAKNSVSPTSSTPTTKESPTQKKTATATKNTPTKSKSTNTPTLQDKKQTEKTKEVILRQLLAQATTHNRHLPTTENTTAPPNESQKDTPLYRRRNFQIGLATVLLCIILAYALLSPKAPLSKEIPIYKESSTGYYYRDFFTVKTLLDRHINIFDQKAWTVIQLKRAGQDTANAVKERDQAYQDLLKALKEKDTTGKIVKDLQSRQAAIAKTLSK